MKKDKFRELVREEVKNILEDDNLDKDGEFALKKLHEIRKFAKMIQNGVDEGDRLPEWVMDKFSTAADNLNDVYQYLEGETKY